MLPDNPSWKCHEQSLDRVAADFIPTDPPKWVRTEVLEFPGSVDGPWRRSIDPETVIGRSASGGRQSPDGGGSPPVDDFRQAAQPTATTGSNQENRQSLDESGDSRPLLAAGIGTVKYPASCRAMKSPRSCSRSARSPTDSLIGDFQASLPREPQELLAAGAVCHVTVNFTLAAIAFTHAAAQSVD